MITQIQEGEYIPREMFGGYICWFCDGKHEDPGQIECDTCEGKGQREWEETRPSIHDPGEPYQDWGTCECEDCNGLGHYDCCECDGTGEVKFISCIKAVECDESSTPEWDEINAGLDRIIGAADQTIKNLEEIK